jgi:hypothetical protein
MDTITSLNYKKNYGLKINSTTNMIYPLTIIALIIFIACGMEIVKKINNSL